MTQLYTYAWGPRMPGAMSRKGETCEILVRGKRMNSALVRFADGFLAVVSRNALRKKKGVV
jgi:hypothetical protein